MTIKRWVIHQILIMIVVEALLFGCIGAPTSIFTPLPEQMDKSPFTGIPCMAPCWYGLEVGKSNESEVTSVLSTLTFINHDSTQIFRKPSMPDYYVEEFGPGVKINASCVNPRTEECLVLTTANDVLQKIVIKLNYEIRPDEAIEYLGHPDYIGVSPIGGEIFICEIYLIWENSRLILASTFNADEDPYGVEKYCDVTLNTDKIPSSMLISEVRFLSEGELNALLQGTGWFTGFSGTIPDK